MYLYFQIKVLDLGEDDELIIYSGEIEDSDKELFNSESSSEDHFMVRSGSQSMLVELVAGVNDGGRSLKLTYFSGILSAKT